MTTQPPERIYLQWNCENHDIARGQPDPGDVTWCTDKIFEDDAEYVRVHNKRIRKAKKP